MTQTELSGTTAIVTGASRGFGRAIAEALHESGVVVVGVARDAAQLEALRAQLGDRFIPVVGDASDPILAGKLIDRHQPRTLVLNAGASPLSRPLQQLTWQTFSRNWEVDVQHVFNWTREALLRPLDPGSVVIALSSGAALRGSPLSGGYAGAKATIRFIAAYAASESDRNRLGIRFVSLLPGLTPVTDLGMVGAAAYAARQGVDVTTYFQGRPTLSLKQVGTAVVELATDTQGPVGAYQLTPEGLSPLD